MRDERVARTLRRWALIVPVLAGLWLYASGYGWLVREDRWPDDAGKGGGTCRYQTLRGIRIAYYLGDCPRFATTRFADKSERF